MDAKVVRRNWGNGWRTWKRRFHRLLRKMATAPWARGLIVTQWLSGLLLSLRYIVYMMGIDYDEFWSPLVYGPLALLFVSSQISFIWSQIWVDENGSEDAP